MKYWIGALSAIALSGHILGGSALAQGIGKEVGKPPTVVGMATRDFMDEARRNWQGTGPRPLKTVIWYPATEASREEAILSGPPGRQVFIHHPVAKNAEMPEKSGRYPLVLLSHGTGGSALQMMWLGYYLASRGYIAAAISHHGNTGEEEYAAQGFLLYWERPKDLTAVLDRLLTDPVFGGPIDGDRIGAAGFSLGGYTVIAIAGGIFSQEAFDAFCASPKRDFTCDPQIEFPEAQTKFKELGKTDPVVQEALRHSGDSYRDKRIRGVFAISPALGSGFTESGLGAVSIPVYIVIGDADTVAPLATNAGRYTRLIKGAKLKVLPGKIGHYTFLAECTPHGKKINPLCLDREGVDRAAVHRQVEELVFNFFEQALSRK
jgi:predicted dienelactone hydrolase